ncbi:MAG: type II toxin-antitoxin system RelE/ParE family toxin [Gammaproteobacteria bacterium]|nr:type II toxin-antitoxin system RelE/ParE family toxin [Gammaproteobacteria bacterium]
MRIFKTKWFQKWASKEGLGDEVLRRTVAEMAAGLIDADLGGHVVKKRVALPGHGKRGSLRTLVAFKADDKAFFIYGFAKNERDNIDQNELKALRLLATELLSYGPALLVKAVTAGEVIEVSDDG